jgi:hypothetical protein
LGVVSDEPLFAVEPALEERLRERDRILMMPKGRVPRDPDALSYGQRLTLRQRDDVKAGRHPLAGEPAHPELGTCGGCTFKQVGGPHGWNKCLEPGSPRTSSQSTDVRAWWPACPRFQPKEEDPDAAG